MVSRSEWAVYFLGLPRSTAGRAEPGLILIQVDGLSRSQFDRALERGRLPFMQGLIRKQEYVVRTMYSGLPSTTPSVQGELLYGVRPAVPAFSYRSHRLGRIVKMLEPEVVAELQRELEEQGRGLLEGGSAYSNIYSGGAAEAHFCAATFGWSHGIRTASPFKFALLIALNAGSLLRPLVLMPIEFVLALIDLFRGAIAGEAFGKELKFVPTRVLICILLREWITMGAMMDAVRGLPIIHLNYLGYDEQAHRRGPSSEFAHWTLKGIDFSVRRVYEAARRSDRRVYDVWIYSDHGQERVTPYPVAQGRTLKTAVTEILSGVSTVSGGGTWDDVDEGASTGSQRVRYLKAAKPPPRGPAAGRNGGEQQNGTETTLAAMGPIGHLNFGSTFDRSLIPDVASRLVRDAGIPAVLAADGASRIRAWTAGGIRLLPEELGKVVGEDHPFLPELSTEILELCLHADAGDLVLLGYQPGGKAMSFPIETGAHAGPGPEETLAFALTPPDAPIPEEAGEYHIRPFDLREAALRHLGRASTPAPRKPFPLAEPPPRTLRILTYDTGGCLGRDGRVSTGRIGRVIARHRPDVVCLQHLEGIGQAGLDQAEAVARAVTMDMHVLTSLRMEEAGRGDAVLSRYPMTATRNEELTVAGGGIRKGDEDADVQEVRVRFGQRALRILNVQLSPGGRNREMQFEALLAGGWFERSPGNEDPLVVCMSAGAAPSRRIASALRRLLKEVGPPPRAGAGRRIPAGPRHRCRVYCSPEIEILRVKRPADDLARLASEHAPLIVEIRNPWRVPEPTGAA